MGFPCIIGATTTYLSSFFRSITIIKAFDSLLTLLVMGLEAQFGNVCVSCVAQPGHP